MKFNFKKISTIATSALMIGMSVGVAAAASYPAPFVVGSSADVAIVYGTGAGVSSLDLIQAGNIQTDLQAKMPSTGGTATATGGDSVKIAKASDNLNLGNTFGVFSGTVDEDELSTLLADGTYVADDNDEYDFEQKITLGTPTLTHFRDTDYSDTPTVGFKIGSNTMLVNYTLDFLQDAESDIVSLDMDDIEGSDMVIMGKTYYVSDLKNGTSATYLGKLTLLDSANIATVNEGETITVTSGGNSYEISIDYLDNDEVRFMVNGESAPASGKLQAGESFRLNGGAYIGVRDISRLEIAGETGSATFSIGSGKLEITSASDIKLNDKSITGVKGYVYRGTNSGAAEKVDKIVITWTTDEEVFLTPSSELLMPGFEALKFTMNELVRPEEEKVTIQQTNDDSIELKIPIKDGTSTLNILYSNTSGEFAGLGKASDEKLVTSAENSILFYEKDSSGNNQDSYFVASYNISSEAQSYILRAKVRQNTDNARNETMIQKKVDDSWVEACPYKAAGETCDIGDVSLTLTSMEYLSGDIEYANITAGTNVHFNTIYTAGGLRIYLPYLAAANITTAGAINLSDAHQETAANIGHDWDNYYLFMDGEDKDDTIAGGTEFNFTIDDTTSGTVKLYVTQVNNVGTGGPNGSKVDTNIYETYVVDDVAPRIMHYTSEDDDYVEVYYPTGNSETYAEVFLAETGVVLSTSGAAQLGDILVKDSEVSSVSSKNLIVVGGSCINSAAATVLGGSYCGAAFTEATGVGSGQFLIKGYDGAFTSGKLALVVAGYEAADTTNGATYLTTATDVDTSGSYKGTSSTSAEMIVA